MNCIEDSKLTRIGIFYDGNYFLHVSNYYNYEHQRRARISVAGLHEFIKNLIAQEEKTSVRLCQIVDAHYFRGRLSAGEASQNQLYYDRVFDDILMSEGVITHYLPLKNLGGKKEEKGIDVWLALEAFELAFYKRFNVLVLIACDGDYVPLIKKLNTLGTRVMVLSWDFEYVNEFNNQMTTKTSQYLLKEVTYPVAMQEIIGDRKQNNDPLINNLFVQPRIPKQEEILIDENTPLQESTILSLKQGYGFIKNPPNNLFFHHTDLIDVDFNDLEEGATVQFSIGSNDKGESVAKNIKRIFAANAQA
ncbi:NYN domain-containing protein [Crocosphaera sp. XPORK-15E]|uniref:NYN domain-containing protein n=1 Tax=Crocosphaera sp. XPORK-15E TaxID=3110247 RepID=UPI002B21E71A|nr:NYN domain-containing protein [Crocosphaera sp. XPORK-15E]MEA5534279.1 NYN domain-containing protein [Crocosphaera sp. XPORK-15E]